LLWLYPSYPQNELTRLIGRSWVAIRSHAVKLGIQRITEHHAWTADEIAKLRQLYPETGTTEIAKQLSHSVHAIYGQAGILGLHKTKEFIAETFRAKMLRPEHPGRRTQFKPGHIPANKGLRRPGWGPGRMKETQFKKGNRPQTWRPVDSTHITRDGYMERKTRDDLHGHKNWTLEHRRIWQNAHGAIPAGHIVVFRDGNKAHLTLDNLECISRRELLRQNSVHRFPAELQRAIQLCGALKRQINRRTAHGQSTEHQRFAGASV
jgi:hypothetical protein